VQFIKFNNSRAKDRIEATVSIVFLHTLLRAANIFPIKYFVSLYVSRHSFRKNKSGRTPNNTRKTILFIPPNNPIRKIIREIKKRPIA